MGVNAIILKNNKILTIKRKKEPWAGMYALPGGRIEENETEVEATKREVKEETGFEVETKESDYVGTGIFLYKSKKLEVAFYKSKIIGGKQERQEEEVEEIKWLKIEEFVQNLKKHKFPQEGIKLLFKFIK